MMLVRQASKKADEVFLPQACMKDVGVQSYDASVVGTYLSSPSGEDVRF